MAGRCWIDGTVPSWQTAPCIVSQPAVHIKQRLWFTGRAVGAAPGVFARYVCATEAQQERPCKRAARKDSGAFVPAEPPLHTHRHTTVAAAAMEAAVQR